MGVPNKSEQRVLIVVAERLGSETKAREWLYRLGIRTYLAAQPATPFVGERRNPFGVKDRSIHPEADKLRELFSGYGLLATKVRKGRPASATLTADPPRNVADSEIYSDEPLVFGESEQLVAIAIAQKRTAGSASFTIKPPTKTTVWSASVFVLLDEMRAWLMTRDELVRFHRQVRQHGTVPHVGYDKKRQTLRVRFPVKPVGYDLSHRLRRQS